MSYILDALRKSDQKRQQGAAPTLASAPIPAAETAPRRQTWLVAMAVGLFVAGIVIGWWKPWQVEPPHADARVVVRADEVAAAVAPTASASMPAPVAAPPARAAGAEPPRAAPGSKAPPPVSVATPAVPQTAASAGANSTPRGQSQADQPPPIPAPARVEAEARPERKSAPATDSAVAAIPVVTSRAELPPAVQQELPKMVVSLHAYSPQPRNRLVSVNDQLLHEGDSLAPGLVLEQIRTDDMVFGYKGFRFRQGVQ